MKFNPAGTHLGPFEVVSYFTAGDVSIEGALEKAEQAAHQWR